MSTAILLFVFGSVHTTLGLIWDVRRKRITSNYSPKYRAIWLIGLLEMIVSVVWIALNESRGMNPLG